MLLGRAVAIITGETSRIYPPQVRWVEIQHQRTHERYQIPVGSDDHLFGLTVPPGDYVLTRVQISEGPFLSLADLSMNFSVRSDGVTYAGTWRFGVDSPRYGRMVLVSLVQDHGDQMRAEEWLHHRFPKRQAVAWTATLPEPTEGESRLYEVMPYPRYQKYFRRHLW